MDFLRKVRKALETLKKKLDARKDALAKARRRYKQFHALTVREHERHLKAEREGHTLRAERFRRRAEARQKKAIHWRGVIKRELIKVHGLEKRIEDREADIKKWKKEHGVYFEGPNKVRGGTREQRLRVAIHTAALNYRKGTQPGYYSQTGAARKYSHGLYHYPFGHIWDCSTFADAMYFVCGLESPSGPGAYRTGGWTGTEVEHGRRIPESEARAGDLVIYGPGVGHHVEVVDDPKAKTTIGHGDSAINASIFNMFGDGDYHIRRYN